VGIGGIDNGRRVFAYCVGNFTDFFLTTYISSVTVISASVAVTIGSWLEREIKAPDTERKRVCFHRSFKLGWLEKKKDKLQTQREREF
jgi:hypothetical protein